MRTTKRSFVTATLVSAIALTIGCATTRDTVSRAERSEKKRPGIGETKAIAEEGFIYGLPIVMNYAVLVGDDVRREDAAPDQEPDQPLPDQLPDAAGHEEEPGGLAHALHPEGLARGGKASNWLPAPAGPIYLVMRLYWPSDTPPSILPPGQGTWKPPGVKRAS